MLVVFASVMFTAAIASAETAPSAKKPKLKVSDSQKKILKKRALEVKIKGFDRGKTKLKATSTTFDQQQAKKLAKPTTARAGQKKVLLRLTGKGKKAIKSCEARKIQVKGKGF